MSENLALDSEGSAASAVERVDLKAVTFAKPGRKERAYVADQVDALVDNAQAHLDYRDELIQNLNRQLEDTYVTTDTTERLGLLEASNAELRRRLQEALNVQHSSAEEATGILEHAHRVAQEYLADARQEAAQIVQDAYDSLASLHEEIAATESKKQAALVQLRALVSDLDS